MDLQSIKNRFGIIGNSAALNHAFRCGGAGCGDRFECVDSGRERCG